MLDRYRFALRPGWVALHVLAVVLIVTMTLLGRWQLDVSDAKHFDLQNFGYAFQWWAFCVFVLLMWARFLRDARRRRDEDQAVAGGAVSQVAEAITAAAAPVAYRRYVMPSSSEVPDGRDDAVLGAYNDYLAGLAHRAEPGRDEPGTGR